VPQKKCVFQKNQNKENWRIGLIGGSDVVNKLNIGDGPSLEITHINEILKKIRINFRLGCKYSKIIIKRGTLISLTMKGKLRNKK